MRNKLSISIVLAMYNGAKYIIDQLESIRLQTRKANEVVIMNDCSTDNSAILVQEYIDKFSLKNWKLINNETNVGWRKNFIAGFRIATGDLIFCSDQDDVWKSEKIRKMSEAMESLDDIEVLACNLVPVYEVKSAKKLEHYNVDIYGKEYIAKVIMDKMWMEPRRQGCTMCFRRELVSIVDELWFEECPHDLLLWSYGMAIGKLYILNEQLILFRRHESNNSPTNRKTNSNRFSLLNTYIELGNKIKLMNVMDKERLKIADTMLAFYKERAATIMSKNPIKLLHLIKDIRLYPKRMSFIGDVLATVRIR